MDSEGCSNCVSASQPCASNDFIKAKRTGEEHEKERRGCRKLSDTYRVLVSAQLSHTGCRAFYVNLEKQVTVSLSKEERGGGTNTVE